MGPKSECQPKLTEVDGHSNTAVFRSIPARVVGGAHRLSGADLRPPRPVRVAHCRVHPMRNGRRQLRKCVAFKSVNNGISSQSMMAFRTCQRFPILSVDLYVALQSVNNGMSSQPMMAFRTSLGFTVPVHFH